MTPRASRAHHPLVLTAGRHRTAPHRERVDAGAQQGEQAGSATTAETAEATVTIIPARPIEEMAGMGKSSRQPSAAVTVAALKRTVRPAVVSVRASAAAPGPPLPSPRGTGRRSAG